MKNLLKAFKNEFQGDNLLAAISCLILSITIYFIMGVVGYM
ncbi:hypothetical protein [Poritiphilus flavus]|nr:hypothetical protein [Poritiphilus flavus]